jgi:predicted transcriptional regulator
MKKNEETHCILVSPKLLFGSKNKYNVFYVPWIYVHLKLEKCIIFDKKIRLSSLQLQKHYKINSKEIYNYYGFDKSTFSRAMKQLNAMGLVETNKREHKLINDNAFFHYEKNDPEKENNEGDFPSFVQIYNNFYIDFIELLKNNCDLTNSPGLLMRTVEIFYYLITRNRHILLNIETLESNETIDTLSKYLHHDRDDVNKSLWCLKSIGYIDIDTDGKIYTNYNYGKSSVKKRLVGATRKKQNIEENDEQTVQMLDEQSSQWNMDLIYTDDENFEGSNVIGVKAQSEQTQTEYVPKKEPKGDPITEKEWIKHIELMSNGNNEKFERLINEHNISDKAIEDWRLEKLTKNESQSGLNITEQLEAGKKPEMDYLIAKQHLDYLSIMYQDNNKMFAKEVERRNIPLELLDKWLEEKSLEFALEYD